jgi:ribosomal protein S1
MDVYEKTGEQSLEEEYWQALLRGGEGASDVSLPIENEEVWHGLGVQKNDAYQNEREELSESGNGVESDGWEHDWQLVHRCFMNDETVELPVTGYNRGGLLVQWDHLQGFVPASQLVGMSFHPDEDERREELAGRVGNTLALRVIEIDRERSLRNSGLPCCWLSYARVTSARDR